MKNHNIESFGKAISFIISYAPQGCFYFLQFLLSLRLCCSPQEFILLCYSVVHMASHKCHKHQALLQYFCSFLPFYQQKLNWFVLFRMCTYFLWEFGGIRVCIFCLLEDFVLRKSLESV